VSSFRPLAFIPPAIFGVMAEGDGTPTSEQEKEERQSKPWTLKQQFWGKPVWDWLQLLGVLAILVVIAVAGYMFNARQDARQQQLEDQRAQQAQKIDTQPDATPTTSTFTPLETGTNVRDFGATGNGTSNDTAAFERAMAKAARVGGVVYVPAPGHYRIANVNPPSNTRLQVQAGASLKKYGSGNGPLFNVQGPNDTTFVNNVHIEGVDGNFTMDLYDAGQETGGIQYRNVRNFSLRNMVCIQNNDNPLQKAPSSRRPCVSFLPTPAGPVNGVYNHPIDGVLENVHSKGSPYGWGLTQLTGGENLRFLNISSEGGVPLRLESFRGNWTPIDNIFAEGVTCKNGHDAVHVNPHNATHGTFSVQNVVADSCESAIRLANDADLAGSYAGGSTITGVTVIPGDRAQLRDDATTGYVGAWVAGPSRWCIDNDVPLGYTVGLSDVDCGGLSNHHPKRSQSLLGRLGWLGVWGVLVLGVLVLGVLVLGVLVLKRPNRRVSGS